MKETDEKDTNYTNPKKTETKSKTGQNLVLDKWNATMNCVGWHL